MFRKVTRYLHTLRQLQRMNVALSRGAAARGARQVDLADPASWEFSGFSQNGEDGILEVLHSQLSQPNRYFLEIGASDGLENNTTWLAIVRRFSGVWIEGDPVASTRSRELFTPLNYGVEARQVFVTRESAAEIPATLLHQAPDVLSLDIDGNDFHVAEALLGAGLRPKICVVEYNSAFGPERRVTVPYDPGFRVVPEHARNLYYGCSIAAWRALFAREGYRFVTVDLNGVNAFFADPASFRPGFLEGLSGRDFQENFSQLRQYRAGWERQSALLDGRPLLELA